MGPDPKNLVRTGTIQFLATTLCLLLIVSVSAAQSEKTELVQKQFNVFDMPNLSERLALVFGALKAGRFEIAEKSLRRAIERYPDRAQNHFLIATVFASQNKQKEALDALENAVNYGFQNSERLQKDPNLKSIRSTARFKDLAEKVLKIKATESKTEKPRIEPYLIENNEALVSMSNTSWNGRFGVLLSRFEFNSRRASPVTVQNVTDDPIAKQLNEWFRRGYAAGNSGDLYDNRDHQHSSLSKEAYPQLGFVEYSPEAKNAGIDYGLNTKILFNAPTIGNSSTGVNGMGSQAGLAYTLPFAMQKLYLQYLQNQMYVYPAVDDYSEKNGDVLSATTPYIIVSQGRSGSDIPFLRALASILAAFDPGVKDALVKRNLLMPTVQMILREGQIPLENSEDYLTYKAHPPVFDSQNLDVIRMIRMAQELELEKTPPMVLLSIVSESAPKAGIDELNRKLPKTLFNTPGAIARVVRSTAKNTSLVVSAEKTKTPVGQKLSYHWVVLRGESKNIKIVPKNSEGSVVEITVPWHDGFPAPDRPDFQTHRVEIGVFVNNGTYYSAPSFVSFLFPANQRRSYNENNQIASIDYRTVDGDEPYVDSQIFAARDWRDDFSYDEQGLLIGWRRTRGNIIDQYTADGFKVVTQDKLGRPLQVEKVKYIAKQQTPRHSFFVERATGEFATYKYKNDTDKTGVLKKN